MIYSIVLILAALACNCMVIGAAIKTVDYKKELKIKDADSMQRILWVFVFLTLAISFIAGRIF